MQFMSVLGVSLLQCSPAETLTGFIIMASSSNLSHIDCYIWHFISLPSILYKFFGKRPVQAWKPFAQEVTPSHLKSFKAASKGTVEETGNQEECQRPQSELMYLRRQNQEQVSPAVHLEALTASSLPPTCIMGEILLKTTHA